MMKQLGLVGNFSVFDFGCGKGQYILFNLFQARFLIY